MVEIEKTAYPRFSKHKKLTDKTLQTIYTPSQEEVLMAEQYTKDPHNKFKFLILLKSFQKLGYFLPIEEIPNQIKTHIAGCLQLPEDLEINYSNKKTFHSHKQLIRTLLLINPFDKKAQELAQNIGMEHRTEHEIEDQVFEINLTRVYPVYRGCWGGCTQLGIF